MNDDILQTAERRGTQTAELGGAGTGVDEKDVVSGAASEIDRFPDNEMSDDISQPCLEIRREGEPAGSEKETAQNSGDSGSAGADNCHEQSG